VAVLVGVFEAQEAAERAFVRLRDVGVPDENLALIANAVHAGPATSAADLAAEHEAALVAPDDLGETVHSPVADEDAPVLPVTEETVAEQSEAPTLDAAAFGAAVGVIIGGGMGGPLGAIAGTAVGAGIGGFLASRGMESHEATTYEDAVRSGRFLVAVDTGAAEPTPEMRAILEVAGAQTVAVE
jgi:uncharacterized protein YcfJ